MAATRIQPDWKIAVGLPAAVFAACFIVTLLPVFRQHNALLSNAVLADLLLTAPLLYLLAIRKSGVSKLTVTRVFVAGVIAAGLLLNTAATPLLHIIKTWVSPVMELVVIWIIARKFYTANKKAKAGNGGGVDFLLHCRVVLRQVMGSEKAGNIIASEIAVLYYAFATRKYRPVNNTASFTGYKKNGIVMVLGVILAIFLMEAAGMHFVIRLWSGTAAWIITSLSLYTCIQLFAHIRAIMVRPIIISKGSVHISNGLAADVTIACSNIEKTVLTNKIPQDRKWVKTALLQGFEGHNIAIYLKEPVAVTKLFGIKKYTDTVLFFVDDAKGFAGRLSEL